LFGSAEKPPLLQAHAGCINASRVRARPEASRSLDLKEPHRLIRVWELNTFPSDEYVEGEAEHAGARSQKDHPVHRPETAQEMGLNMQLGEWRSQGLSVRDGYVPTFRGMVVS